MFPSFANAEYIDAICIGLTKTSPCPYPESANFFSLSILSKFEYCDFFIVNGNLICSFIDSLNPNFFNSSQNVALPICIAACAKKILSE